MANPLTLIETLGRKTLEGVEEIGYHAALLVESLYWLLWGPISAGRCASVRSLAR